MRVKRFQEGGPVRQQYNPGYGQAPGYNPAAQGQNVLFSNGPGTGVLNVPDPLYTQGPGVTPDMSGIPESLKQGGAMGTDDEEMKFRSYLAEAFDADSEETLNKIVKNLGKEGLQKVYMAFRRGIPAAQLKKQMNQPTMARNGARLCPEGMKLIFRKGGCMCDKMEDGGKTSRFGKKPLQKKNVNPNDTIHYKGKAYDIKDGKTGYPKMTKEQYRKLPASEQEKISMKQWKEGDIPIGCKGMRFKCGGKKKKRFGNGGEFQDGIGMKSFADRYMGKPAEMKCGGKTKKKLVKKKK